MTSESTTVATSPGKGAKRSERLSVWLQEESRRWGKLCLAGSVALAICSVALTWLTYQVVWFVLLFCGGSLLGSGTTWTAALITLALFPLNLFTNRRHLEDMRFETDPNLRLLYRVDPVFDAGWVALANKQNFESFVKLISLIVLSGPQLATSAWRVGAKGLRLIKLDPAGPSKVLSHLLTHERKFTLEEIAEKFPKAQIAEICSPLLDIDGVLLRLTDPPGLSLEDHLREKLVNYLEGT